MMGEVDQGKGSEVWGGWELVCLPEGLYSPVDAFLHQIIHPQAGRGPSTPLKAGESLKLQLSPCLPGNEFLSAKGSGLEQAGFDYQLRLWPAVRPGASQPLRTSVSI